MIHLDTHVIVWLYYGEVKLLSEKAKALLEDNELVISPIVMLELQYLQEVQKITDKSLKIINVLKETVGLKIDEAGFNEIILEGLPHFWTRDPFDRIIVAQAAINRHKLLTKDERIHKYYKQAVWE
ncbi:MAG: type II toxin-antitoxin system VapC family toxin [Candidatus Omnitrophica bacterium]|nr:type II toxin-antitoxin system VapC family toxin [Candidatus Omnitrophota bacterium]